MIDQEQDSFGGNEVRAGGVDAHTVHLFGQLGIPSGAKPTAVEFRTLPTEADDGNEFLIMEDLNDGFLAVASVVGAIGVYKCVFSGRQIGIGGEKDSSNLAFGTEKFSGWDGWIEHSWIGLGCKRE